MLVSVVLLMTIIPKVRFTLLQWKNTIQISGGLGILLAERSLKSTIQARARDSIRSAKLDGLVLYLCGKLSGWSQNQHSWAILCIITTPSKKNEGKD